VRSGPVVHEKRVSAVVLSAEASVHHWGVTTLPLRQTAPSAENPHLSIEQRLHELRANRMQALGTPRRSRGGQPHRAAASGGGSITHVDLPSSTASGTCDGSDLPPSAPRTRIESHLRSLDDLEGVDGPNVKLREEHLGNVFERRLIDAWPPLKEAIDGRVDILLRRAASLSFLNEPSLHASRQREIEAHDAVQTEFMACTTSAVSFHCACAGHAITGSRTFLGSDAARKYPQQFDGDRDHEGGILLCRHFVQCLQVAQLKANRLAS
jgi:hypothetical protein